MTPLCGSATGCAAAPREVLRWVKLPAMRTFWPACVYADYDEALAHAHDVWTLRSAKPSLDEEDRVVYFFGVGPRACHVAVPGSAPDEQLRVEHKDDLTKVRWSGVDDFAQICHDFLISDDVITRAKNTKCFRRACDEAATYARDVHTNKQATMLFISLLRSASRVQRTEKLSAARDIISKETESAGTSVVEVASVALPPSPKKAADSTKSATKSVTTTSVDELLKTPRMKAMVAKCWQQMLEGGWETVTQADGHVLYKRPGTSFLNFTPNVNVFDSLEKACAKYLSDWVQRSMATASTDREGQAALTEFLWPMAVESGWETMTTANESWYKNASTPFSEWEPNVTIFSTKTQAMAKYLEECGLAGPSAEATHALDEGDNAASDYAASEDETEASDPSDTSEDEDGATQQPNETFDLPETQEEFSDRSSDNDNNNDDDDYEDDGDDDGEGYIDGESEDEEEVAPAKPAKTVVKKSAKKKTVPKKTAKKVVASSAHKKPTTSAKLSRKPAKKPSHPEGLKIPEFKLTLGNIEAELKRRGWSWKDGNLDFTYFKPSCGSKPLSSLVHNQDYFNGRVELEEYLASSSFGKEVHDTLRQKHEDRYRVIAEEEARDVKSRPNTKRPKPSRSRSMSVRGRSKSGRSRSKSVSRAPRGRSVHTTPPEKKFGNIWRVLSEDGWHLKPGKYGYDYFKPHCASTSDGEVLKDYFPSDSQLIEYLQESGLWDQVAARVRAEAASSGGSSGDEDMEDASHVAPSSTNKRPRAEESTPSSLSTDKRQKRRTDFQTPTEAKRPTTIDLTDEDDKEKPIEETISPAAAGVKGRDPGHDNAGGVLRNLANSFTPSPAGLRKPKLGQRKVPSGTDVEKEPAKEPSARQRILDAIQKLTSGYMPANLQYRDDESEEIRAFFRGCFQQEEKTSLYVSGSPGCGKSALLKSMQSEIDDLYQECCPDQGRKTPIRSHVNAVALRDSRTLFCQLAQLLTNDKFSSGDAAFKAIEQATDHRLESSKTMILVLDEIDILLKNNGIESDLCKLFELAHRASNSFILVGIANQVDFTERHLPMLQQRLPECCPRVVIFKPYAHSTIEAILFDRLGGKAAGLQMLSAHGLSYLARKVASTTGDIRLAVDTCRRVLQHKLELSDKESSENGPDDASLARPLPMSDMLRVIKHALESKSGLIIRSLPRNLQMILFASTRLMVVKANATAASGNGAAPLSSVNELYLCYCEVSSDAGVFQPLGHREFRSSLDILSSEGLVAPGELKKQLVKLLFSPSELLQCFRKDPYFSRLV